MMPVAPAVLTLQEWLQEARQVRVRLPSTRDTEDAYDPDLLTDADL